MNRGGGKFLRPANSAAPVFDDSSDESDDDVEEEMPPPPPKKTTQTANAKLSSSDDESDDDEEDEVNETSNKRSRADDGDKPKPKKTKPSSSFFDEEAQASDDDEEDEEEYGTHHDPHDKVKKHYSQEDIRRENMDDEALEIINRQNRRRMHLSKFTTEDDVEDIARQIEERHKMESRRVDRAVLDDASIADGGNQNLSAVTQQSLLPSVSDPSLWMFGCQTGKEQEYVYQIMNKCIAFARQGKPLGISSAVAAQSKGRIYIESYSEPAVREAVTGIRGLMAYSMRLVPINDMTTVMTVTSKKKPGKLK